ncbi:MAG: ABC transporter permease subunit [Bifidobacterium sp.]|uniref:ABC transporter permease subunit n=1 Tax=Bifidobacterium fermentum TaxID=3059035 RepID=A0AB39UMU0_9BIFI
MAEMKDKAGEGATWKPYDRPSKAFTATVLTVFCIILGFPLIGMLYFTFRSSTGGFTIGHWAELFASSTTDIWDSLGSGLVNSLLLVALTILIEYAVVIPAIILIDVRFPRVQRKMRIFMLLPIAIPAIILVVGLAPIFSVLSEFLGSGTWTLAFAYGIIAMPFVYTTIASDLDGMNAKTLTQAAESLGASWWRTLIDIIVPSLRRSISSVTLITAAIVLGEYTIASLLNRETLQTDLVMISQSDVYLSVIITFIVLVVTFVALFLVSGIGRGTRKSRSGEKTI